ncbi:12608_t:CDS:2 [Ambispora leptoticha]|uniref:12608_t:CDS:1 n=1 Tax=Ambispora leptoticha TaxID=144679 RepID=A0A9N9G9W3_9GLOM|nr:12608_t:CDS:2 [Ambispora leptoticha]
MNKEVKSRTRFWQSFYPNLDGLRICLIAGNDDYAFAIRLQQEFDNEYNKCGDHSGLITIKAKVTIQQQQTTPNQPDPWSWDWKVYHHQPDDNYFLDGTLDVPKIVISSKYYKVAERSIVEILKQDDKNIQEIIDAAISAGSLSAIVIIANGIEPSRSRKPLIRLSNNLPDQIFYMDNQAFCTKPEIWKDDEDERHTVQYHWDKSV